MSVHRIHRPVFAVLLVLVAGSTLAAEPPVDDSAKLKEYEVGNSKTLPKSDDAVSKVERPKADIVGRFQFEMPVLEVVPMVVAPMTVSPAPVAAAPTGKPAIGAPSKPAPNNSAAPNKAVGAGAIATVPAAPARPGPSSAGALPQAGGGGDVTLVPISTPAPEYPREASMAGITGYVVVTFTLNIDGVPQDIAIAESAPPRVFDQSARRAVARWRFEPVVINGQAVERKVQRRIDFK